jgi:hypothetical protein
MSASGYAARVGAAAFLLGAALAGPLAGTAPVAAADSPAESPSVAGPTDTDTTAKPARTARGPKAASRGSTIDRNNAPRAAAAGAPAAADSKTRTRHASRAQSTLTAPDAPVLAASADPDANVVQRQPGRAGRAAVTAPIAAVPAGEPAVDDDVVQAPPAVTAAAPTEAIAVPAAPTALATVSAAGGLTSSRTGVLDGLFGSFRGFFEGLALSWRRRLFNEAPNVSPIQLTGLTDGPITGSIGAVDPEDDPLAYSVTGDPRYGTVTVGQDGTYTYTPGTDFAGNDSFIVAVTDTGFHINLLDLRRPTSTDASVSVAQGVSAPLLRFQFVYGSGSQFWSAQARSALESTATQLAGYFVVSSPVTVTYSVTGQSSPFSSTLATAGSEFIDPGTGFMQTVVQKKIQTGIDANGSTADGEITWNFGPSWGYGNSVSTTQYDFQSTAMHELVHTLGFLSYADRAGNNTGQTWTIFDSYLVNSAGTEVIGTDYRWKPAYNTNLTGGSGGLFFGGPSAVAAYGGLVPLYTPRPYSSGSSMSHLNDDAFTGAGEKLMNAVSGQGKGVRVLSPVELGILADIGYQLAPSGTPTLMFVGFIFTRRLRKKL